MGADGSVVLVDSGNRRVVRLSADGALLEEAPMPGRNNAMVMSVAALRGRRMAVAGPTVTSARLAMALWDGDDVVAASLPARLGELHFMPHQGTLVRWSDDDWVFGFFNGNGWATFREAKLLGIFPYVEHSEFPRTGYARQGKRVRTWVAAKPVESGRSLSVVGDTLFVLFGGETVAGWALDWTSSTCGPGRTGKRTSFRIIRTRRSSATTECSPSKCGTCTLVSWRWRGGRLQQARAGGSGSGARRRSLSRAPCARADAKPHCPATPIGLEFPSPAPLPDACSRRHFPRPE